MITAVIREHVVKRIMRSSGWGRVRREHIKKHPACAACGTKKEPEVHHIKDFSTYPDLELEPTNLITLCGKRCHFLLGHLKSWRSINPTITDDAKWLIEKIRNRRGRNENVDVKNDEVTISRE